MRHFTSSAGAKQLILSLVEHCGCQSEGSPPYTLSIVLFSNFVNPSKKSNRFDLALRTDRTVVKRPHTWSLPTIYRFAISLDFFVPHPSTWVICVLRIQQYIGMQFPELFVSHLVQLGATHMLSQMERY